jgi:hypothetical protein
MAAPVPTPSGVVRTIFVHSAGSDATLTCRFDMSYTSGPPSTAGLQAIAGAVQTAYATHLAGLLSADDVLSSTEAVDLANPGTPPGINIATTAGSRSGSQTPISVCLNLGFTPNRRYRGSKPKAFFPWGVEADLGSTNEWGPTFLAEIDTAWANFIDEIASTSVGGVVLGTQVAVSYFEGKHANPNPNGRLQQVPTPRGTPLVMQIVAIGAKQFIGSQRRRTRAA